MRLVTRHQPSQDLKVKFNPFNPDTSVLIQSTLMYKIDIDELQFSEPFFQLPNTLCSFYNQETNATLCIFLMNVTKALHNNDVNFRRHV